MYHTILLSSHGKLRCMHGKFGLFIINKKLHYWSSLASFLDNVKATFGLRVNIKLRLWIILFCVVDLEES